MLSAITALSLVAATLGLGLIPTSPSVGTLPAQEVQDRVVETLRILQEGEMTCVG
jgi:hypothetical protein